MTAVVTIPKPPCTAAEIHAVFLNRNMLIYGRDYVVQSDDTLAFPFDIRPDSIILVTYKSGADYTGRVYDVANPGAGWVDPGREVQTV